MFFSYKRKWLKHGDTSAPLAARRYTCLWRGRYNVVANDLSCVLHHCGHPNIGDGSLNAPDNKYNLKLIETAKTAAHHVPYGENVIYQCKDDHFIENTEIDPTKTSIKVQCISNQAEYNVPATWPNCTLSVSCGPSPSAPPGGSIQWLNGTENQVIIIQK